MHTEYDSMNVKFFSQLVSATIVCFSWNTYFYLELRNFRQILNLAMIGTKLWTIRQMDQPQRKQR